MRARPLLALVSALPMLAAAVTARADEPTPGFPEAVLQWDVQKGETCEDIAKALYGDAHQAHLAMRYNRIACTRGAPLKPGTTLVMPAKVTTVPSAVLTSMVPAVRAKPPGASWGDAAPGMALSTNSNVNTMDKASASIHFVDRTRVFLSENTLVVIFGTASQSAVSRAIPPAVEVDAGEIRAALSALRGDSAEVSVPGGGRISAASKDTVVQRKGERTTVAVFDGKARVTNGGKAVDVPSSFGTRFVGKSAPIPPRPLPAAPEWKDAPSGVLFATSGAAQLEAAWKPVPNAKAYRVELATDAAFDALVTRQEVPSDTLAFRAVGLGVGRYFLRVRAIDGEDFLGIASVPRETSVVETVSAPGISLSEDGLTLSPYSPLALRSPPDTQVAIDHGPFVPSPDRIDLSQLRPATVTLRSAGAETTLALHYRLPEAVIDARGQADGSGLVKVELRQLDAEGLEAVAPSLRIRRAGSEEAEQLSLARDPATRGGFIASVPHRQDVVHIEVVDGFGASLGGRDGFEPSPTADAKRRAPRREDAPPRIGVVAAPFAPNPFGAEWSSPTATNAASSSFSLERPFARGRTNVQGRFQASGSLGPVGIDGALFTNDTTTSKASHESAWLGARVRVLRVSGARLEIAPFGRLGAGAGSQPVLGAAGLAVGGVAGRVSWLTDVAFSFRPETRPYVPSLAAGVTYQIGEYLRPFAEADVSGAKVGSDTKPAGGVSLGVEGGHVLFGAASARIAPIYASTGAVAAGMSGMLAIGVRGEP